MLYGWLVVYAIKIEFYMDVSVRLLIKACRDNISVVECSFTVLKITVESWSVIYSNLALFIYYQWLSHWKCTVEYVLQNWIWSVIYQNGSENRLFYFEL